MSLIPAVHTVAFADGWVPDVDEACGIIAAATAAADVREVIDREPLLARTINGEAYWSGGEAEWHWQHLLDRGDRGAMERPLPELVRACSREPRLRQLRPYTSHWSLCFSRCTRYPFTDDGPFIELAPGLDGAEFDFTVTARRDDPTSELRRAANSVAAAAQAAALVPLNCPAVAQQGP
jgi:hypothetical protein